MHPTTPITQHSFDCPLGAITVAATAQGLAGVWFAGQRHWPDTRGWTTDATHPLLLRAQSQLLEYLAGERQQFDLPLDLRAGTPFQQSVWRALLGIPFGSTTRYSTIGAQLGRTQAARAIGAAVGRNPLSMVIPCHRVVGSDGSLTGYAGGLERKTALLHLEARA